MAITLDAPIRYTPSVEEIDPEGERESLTQLEEVFRHILDTTSKDYGHAVRGVHAKGHGIVTGGSR